MAKGKGLQLDLKVTDKGSATIKKVAQNFNSAMTQLKQKATTVSASVSASFKKMGGAMQGLKSQAMGLGVVFVGLAFSAKKLVDSYLVQESAERRLADAMQISGTYTEQNYQGMLNYATALQQVTKYGDEATLELMSLLQVYNLNNEELKWATARSQDFATALGMDVKSSARYMGMALKGNVEMLARYIPALKSTVTEELKTMDASEKVAFFMKLMNEQFGGRAQAEMASYGGKLAWLSNLAGDVKERLGKGLLNAFAGEDIGKADYNIKQLGASVVNMGESVAVAIYRVSNSFMGWGVIIDTVAIQWKSTVRTMLSGWLKIQEAFVWLDKKLGSADTAKKAEQELTGLKQSIIDIDIEIANLEQGVMDKGEGYAKGLALLKEEFQDLRKTVVNNADLKADIPTEFELSLKPTIDKQEVVQVLTTEMQAVLKDYETANKDVGDAIMQLTLDEFDYKIAKLDEYIEAKKQAGVDEEKLEELKTLTLIKIEEERAEEANKAKEKAQEKLKDQQEEYAELMRDNLKDLFLNASEDDFDDWFKRIGDKLKNWVTDISTSMALNTVGKFFGQDELIKGGGNFGDFFKGMGGLLGIGREKAPAGGVYDYGAGMSYPEGQGPDAVGAGSGAVSAGVGGAVAGATGGATAVIGGVGAVIGLGMSAYSYTQSKQQDREDRRRAEGQEFIDELESWVNESYDSLEEMLIGATESIFSADKLHNAIEYAKFAVSEWAFTWQNAMGVVHASTVATGKTTVANLRLLANATQMVADTSPQMKEEFEGMREKMEEAFASGILEDFTKGLITTDKAVKQMMATGMDQLSAQTAIFGKEYNALIVAIDGSIETYGKTETAFNNMRDTISEFEEEINRLPDGLGETKEKLMQLTFAMEGMVSIAQSATDSLVGLAELPDAVKSFNVAIAEGDWENAIKSLEKMQDTLLSLADTFSSLGQLEDPFGGMGSGLAQASRQFVELYVLLELFVKLPLTMLVNWEDFRKGFAGIVAEVVGALSKWGTAWKEFLKLANTDTPILDMIAGNMNDIAYAEEDLLNKWALWVKGIEDAELPDLIGSALDKFVDFKDVLAEAQQGETAFGMDKMLEEFAYYMLEVQRLVDENAISQEQYETMTTTAVEAYTEQINQYFDAVLKGFEDLQKAIDKDIQSLNVEGRTVADVSSEMDEVWGELGGLGGFKEEMDVEEWLSNAERMRSLVLERYQIEKAGIEKQIAEAERLKDVFTSLADNVRNTLLDIQTSGLNPEVAEDRGEYLGDEAQRLRDAIAGESDAGTRAGMQGELANVLKEQLSMSVQYMQRPSPEYRALYASITDEIKALQVQAEKDAINYDKVSVDLQAELVALATTTQTELKFLKGYIGGATTVLEEQRDDYLNLIMGDIETLKDHFDLKWGLTDEPMREDMDRVANATEDIREDQKAGNLTLAQISRRIFGLGIGLAGLSLLRPHATGIDNVPTDNYPALLHKGEAVVRARENTGTTLNFNVSVNATGGGDAKAIADGLKQEIKFGELGNVIEDRIKKIA